MKYINLDYHGKISKEYGEKLDYTITTFACGEIEFNQSWMFSVRGNLFCPLEQREVAWKNYLSTYDHYYKALSINTTNRINKNIKRTNSQSRLGKKKKTR